MFFASPCCHKNVSAGEDVPDLTRIFQKRSPAKPGFCCLQEDDYQADARGAPAGRREGGEHDGFGVGRGLFEGRRRRRKLGRVDLLAVMEAAAHGERGGGDNDESYNGAHD